MDQANLVSQLEKLTSCSVRVISNGFILRTRSGSWYYKTEADLLSAIKDYLGLMLGDYDRLSKQGGK